MPTKKATVHHRERGSSGSARATVGAGWGAGSAGAARTPEGGFLTARPLSTKGSEGALLADWPFSPTALSVTTYSPSAKSPSAARRSSRRPFAIPRDDFLRYIVATDGADVVADPRGNTSTQYPTTSEPPSPLRSNSTTRGLTIARGDCANGAVLQVKNVAMRPSDRAMMRRSPSGRRTRESAIASDTDLVASYRQRGTARSATRGGCPR
jgi:hypothetical protein